MKSYHITGPGGLASLKQVDIGEPELGPLDVLVEMKSWSLNYRDLAMPFGGYIRNDKVKRDPPLIPLSDGAGEVIAVGKLVTRFKVGDHVASLFFQKWLDGDLTDPQIGSALGGAVDGVLSERVALHEDGWVSVPQGYLFEEATTLPCAALTAWQALTLATPQPGQVVLMLGTGGVSIFALQLAKIFGMRTIITSSSDEKLERAKGLGADVTINYKKYPDWERLVLDETDGIGVDNVIEVGGAGTFEKSLASAKVSGRVSLIGVLTGNPEQNPSPMMTLFKRLTVQGIYVGSRQMFEAMNRAIEVNSLRPVIDKRFDFDDVPAAYEHLQSGAHFGKIVITRGE
ncbi:NAD(P)-dependent alcohol dehydrogenase [Stieleria sp. JC731]|uniref:zinc-dependent alcohol dehydrogenase family protein n=1 Tax=Pirellulaceae TaxID=2691357 RepID=UPI001E2ABB60|nr:NAD(P)-dependent alcohol dehydrogenase [Stieleria sp. JC731]MCC9600615.1 NAD(P)-dependent alcohol dehydrogenase [Stieleria sp. JC731]